MSVSSVENNAARGRPFEAGQPNPGFKPGQSGNPGGRPKGLARRVRDEVGAGGDELVAIMVEIARDRDASRRDRMAAVGWLTERGWGKQSPVVGDEPDVRAIPMFDPDKLTKEELETLVEIMRKAEPDAERSGNRRGGSL